MQAFRDLYVGHPDDVIDRVVAYHKAHEGISRVVKILHCHNEFLGIDLDEAEHRKLCRRYAEIVEEKVVGCPEISGAGSFLSNHQHKSRFFVVSGTPEDELRRITGGRELDKYFEGIYGSPRAKDEIVNEVLERTGLGVGDCLFVGDAMTDYRAAEATGVPFIGRVDDGANGPFPDGTPTVSDLNILAEILLGDYPGSTGQAKEQLHG